MTRWLLRVLLVLVLLPPLVISGKALAQDTGEEPIRVEVSRNGFNNTPGEFPLQVEEWQQVEVTFVYGDGDLNNRHQIFITGYNIDSGVLDQENPEVTVRFTATNAGEVSFMCILSCEGHSNLQGGRIVIEPTDADGAGVIL